MLVMPESGGRHGPKPELIRLPNFPQEADDLAQRLHQFHERGISWKQMAVVYRERRIAETICDRFQQAQIPIEWINRNQDSRFYDPAAPSVKLVTVHSSKGLEFPVVCIPGVGRLPNSNETVEDEARLLYVGITRAVDQLLMTYDRSSEFVQRLESALAGVG